MYEDAAKVYMVHLVGCIILEDNSHVYIDVRYIAMLVELVFHSWAYGCTAMTLLYHALGEATTFETRKHVGYMSLLQV